MIGGNISSFPTATFLQAEGMYYFTASSLLQPGKFEGGKWRPVQDPVLGKVSGRAASCLAQSCVGAAPNKV